jgi:outer membrane protein assembly factor BamB
VKRRTFWRWVSLFAVLLAVVPTYRAYAVVPAVVGPLQALMAILPQLLALAGAGIVALAKPETYSAFFKFIWNQKILTICLIAGFTGAVYGLGILFGGGVTEVEEGKGWPAMRGGATRTGAVAGAKGPQMGAKTLWNYAGKKREQIDSSPAIVGNRIYTSSAVLNLFAKDITGTGTIYCRDTNKGGVVWKFTGDKKMGERLASIFSSPAVGGEYPATADGADPEPGRYLVCGEGYHQDINSRFFCLDLAPTRNGKQPKFVWSKRATSHVESSPAIHKCVDGKWRTYIGAGDDGIWSVELETGNVSWMVEGTPHYIVAAKCKDLAAIKALKDKKIVLTCIVDRVGSTITDPGQLLINSVSKAAREMADGEKVPVYIGDEYKRTIVGTVEVLETQPTIEDPNKPGTRIPCTQASMVRISVPRYYLDVESAPAVVDFPVKADDPKGKQRSLLFFGTGLGGKSGVACVNAVNGEEVWFYPVPNPVFAAPTIVKGAKITRRKDGKEVETDVLLVGYGEGDFVTASNDPGYVVCLDIHNVKDGAPEMLWVEETANQILGAVAVKKGKAYACSRNGVMSVIDLKTGTTLKKIRAGTSLVCSPAVTDDAVYITSMSGMAYCIDLKSNAERWKMLVTPSPNMFSSPVVSDGKLYIGTPGEGLFCLTEAPATRIKPFSGPGGNAARTATADISGLADVEGKYAGRRWSVFRLRKRTGPGPVAAIGGNLFMQLKPEVMVKGQDGSDEFMPDEKIAKLPVLLSKVSGSDASVLWQVDIKLPASAIAGTASQVFVLAGKEKTAQSLICLDNQTGKELSRSAAIYHSEKLALESGKLLLQDKNGLICLNLADQAKVWSRAISGSAGSPAVFNGMAFVALTGNSPALLALDLLDGTELWHSLLPSQPLSAPGVAGDRVAVGCAATKADPDVPGWLVSVRITSGRRYWKTALTGKPLFYPVLDETYTAIVTQSKDEYFLDAFETSKQALSSISAEHGRVHAKAVKAEKARQQQRFNDALKQAGISDPKDRKSINLRSESDPQFKQHMDNLAAQDVMDLEILSAKLKDAEINELDAAKINVTYTAKSLREGYRLTANPRPPAMVSSTLVYASQKKGGIWSLPTDNFTWKIKGSSLIGNVYSQPLIMDSTVYFVTEDRGLIGFGDNRTLMLMRKLSIDKKWSKYAARKFLTIKTLYAASLAELAAAGERLDAGTAPSPEELAQAEAYKVLLLLSELQTQPSSTRRIGASIKTLSSLKKASYDQILKTLMDDPKQEPTKALSKEATAVHKAIQQHFTAATSAQQAK